MKILQKKFVILASLFLIAFSAGGCGMFGGAVENISSLLGANETGTVINRAYIRSSYAVVAADLLEVKRGETLDILEETDSEKVRWFRVRARDEDNTEGWIEAQNIITGTVLDKSKKLFQEDKDLPAQAAAQLRAASNLRLSPEQKSDNLLLKLENGAPFEVISWRYVPKAHDAADVDDASRTGERTTKKSKTKNADVEAAREANEPEDLDDKYDIWYKVRLDPSVSPAPAGWVFGRQVELQVPSDIVFYQTDAKKFVTWQRIDDAVERLSPRDRDTARAGKPGSWVILSRSNTVRTKEGNEADFDGILVLGYDKYNEDHYTAYKIADVWGQLPLKVEGAGDNKFFTVRLMNANGELEEKRFAVSKNPKGRISVTAPPDIFTEKSNERN